jgi:hypothetical protein
VARLAATAVLVAMLSCLVGAGPVSARVQGSKIGNPSIGKIIFGGTPTNPGITITGSDLTYDPYYGTEMPTPSPTFSPGGHPGCPVNFKGPQGHDYGTRLFVVDKSAKPIWAAGRYRPQLGELDCIGLIVEKWESGAIQFHFGSYFRIGHFHLDKGDFVQLVWNHLGTGVHVDYVAGGVNPGS